ncbi:MAG: LemA family protein [Bdellovibrio sp.]|nr:LemA family protein [Bdellovibrio sp.]
MRNTILIVFLIILLSIVSFIMWAVGVNNKLVSLDESFNEKKAQVENVYQRRMDLVPNLVNTVKGYAKHEANVFEEVTKARSQVGQVKLDISDMHKFEQAQTQLSSALSRLLLVVEKYPDLKANQNFLELQSQLEGTENRITIERQRFNESAREYNTYIRKFPQSIVAGFRGFKEKMYFSADPGAAKSPKVEF